MKAVSLEGKDLLGNKMFFEMSENLAKSECGRRWRGLIIALV